MNERCDITLQQADDGPSPPNLLRKIVEEVEIFAPSTLDAAEEYVQGKLQQKLGEVEEIKERICAEVANLEIERRKLIQHRDEVIRDAKVLNICDRDGHEEDVHELETSRLKERSESLKEVVDAIRALRELGVDVKMDVVRRAESHLSNEGNVS